MSSFPPGYLSETGVGAKALRADDLLFHRCFQCLFEHPLCDRFCRNPSRTQTTQNTKVLDCLHVLLCCPTNGVACKWLKQWFANSLQCQRLSMLELSYAANGQRHASTIRILDHETLIPKARPRSQAPLGAEDALLQESPLCCRSSYDCSPPAYQRSTHNLI